MEGCGGVSIKTSHVGPKEIMVKCLPVYRIG
jgi:hypothetical protein